MRQYAIPIGNYLIWVADDGKIGIQVREGESGIFSEKELEKVIDKFYKENF